MAETSQKTGFLRYFARNDDGGSAVEFAVTAPVVLLAVLGAIEVLMTMFVSTLMEGAIREASRFGKTGFIPAGSTREAEIANIINTNTFGLVDIQPANVVVQAYQDFDSVGKPEPYDDDNGNGSWDAGEPYTDVNGNGQWDEDQGSTGAGGAGDVVRYTINYPWGFMTPVMAEFAHLTEKINLSATVVVRNEPWTAGGSGTGTGSGGT